MFLLSISDTSLKEEVNMNLRKRCYTRVWEKLEDYSGGWIEGVGGGMGFVWQNEFGANVLLNLGGGSQSVHLVWCLSIYQSL